MFYSRMTAYTLYQPTITTDTVGYQSYTFSALGTIQAYITHNSVNTYTANNFDLDQYKYVAYTTATTPAKGYRVGDAYIIGEVIPARWGSTLYLNKMSDSNG